MDAECVKKECCLDCRICLNSFNSPEEFADHLRTSHCSQEGGSFVCLYGENRVCPSLPVEGVSDADYERHIYKHHIYIRSKYQRHKRQASVMSTCSDQSLDDKWNVYSASQNLAAVLNNPHKIKQKDFFTKLWGEGFIEVSHVPDPPYLPTITKQHFDPYLKKLLKRYRRRSKLPKNRSNDPSQVEISPSLSSSKLQSLEKLTFEVPDIFLKSKFDLSCADTFNFVFPHIAECIRPEQSSTEIVPGKTNSPSNRPKLLQERLTHYLDMVEVQIAKQVSSKSDAFFHTMTSHDALMENLGQTITKVRTLRGKIQSIDKSLVTDSLKILKGIRSRNNYCLVLRKLKIMATVYQTQPTVKLLLSTPDYVAALDLIYTTKHLLNNELAGIHCFRHLSSELNEVIKMIDALMTGEMERYATTDLNRPLLESEIQTIEKDKLLCIIMGMLRRQCFSFVDCYWRESYATIKATIKQAVIEIVAESDSPIIRNGNEHLNDALTLDEQLKLLTVEEWVALLHNTATSLIVLLKRIKSAYDVMVKAVRICTDNISSSSSDDGSLSSQKESIITHESEYFLDEENLKIIKNKLSHLITSACQYVSERYAHLLSKRSLTDNVDKMNGKQSNAFKTTTATNWLAEQATLGQLNQVRKYVDELYDACLSLNPNDNVPMALKSAFKTEATKFMKKFHEDRLKKIDMILDTESWREAQVPVEFQSLVNQIIELGKFTTYKVDTKSNISNKPADILYIGKEKFVVIGTVLMLINVISEYCVRAEDITLSAQCLLRYLAELLQLFNRKSCKLVLGGEALSERTGLKKITSSNLALLMRALQLLLKLVPQIKNHFRNLLPPDSQQTISCLDRVSDELHLHVKDISVKMLSIPSQIIATELKNWEAKPPVPSKAFQNLSKTLKKMHEVISGILTDNDVHDLYRKINVKFKEVLRERIVKMNIVNDGGPQHGVVTTELFFYLQDLKKIGALPENELIESSMNDLWS
ncbi:vacuolar protein sorting-associated protein 54-like [Planococcus citri]|uniref:vacuolar protein sorting-associated protein 54-like n=1 Tax=Planococcus citri TaxID=170843 RepID=UPI0031F8DFF9